MSRVGDLHLHSYYSDGEHSIASLINLSFNIGLSFIAITDHDTLNHFNEINVVSSENIEIIKGVEISTIDCEKEYHIIGYFIDPENQSLKNVIDNLSTFRDNRITVMVQNMINKGYELNFEEIQKKASKDFLSRNHIAETLLEKGYIKSIPEAFTSKFIGNTSESYVRGFPISPEVAINAIHLAGGVAILAHPGNTPGIVNSVGIQEIHDLKDRGLDGLEVFQPKHTLEDIKRYIEQASLLNLVITGGSDFHGKYTPDIQLGMIRLPEKYLESLKKLKN